MGSRADLKSRMLRLLREDEEFRYAVAGLIGLEDLRRGQAKFREAVAKLDEAVARLTEGQRRLEETVALLTDGQRRLEEAVAKLADEQRRMWRALRYALRHIQEVSILLEDEARSMIELRLRQRGIEIKLNPLVKPYIELDIYGSDGGMTIIGEAKTRLAPRHVKLLERKLEAMMRHEPELLRGRVVKAFYALWAHPEAVEECRARGIWLNTPNAELTALPEA
jgi:exonuclease VII small subunit